MRRHLLPFLLRHEPSGRLLHHLKSGLGSAIGLGGVGALSSITELPLLIAPLGATVVLLFGQPASPLAQPVNIFGGYLLATMVAVAAALTFPGDWHVAAIAVGVVIAGMLTLRITHPPAGAIPLIALGSPAQSMTLFPTILVACISLLALALLHHRLPPRVHYPRPLPQN
jgi:CBS-domain-containing membrane protein